MFTHLNTKYGQIPKCQIETHVTCSYIHTLLLNAKEYVADSQPIRASLSGASYVMLIAPIKSRILKRGDKGRRGK